MLGFVNSDLEGVCTFLFAQKNETALFVNHKTCAFCVNILLIYSRSDLLKVPLLLIFCFSCSFLHRDKNRSATVSVYQLCFVI